MRSVPAIDEPWEGRSALAWAASGGHFECVDALLAAHASPSLADGSGREPLHHAVLAERPCVFVVRRLLEAGASPNHRDFESRSPLDHVAQRLEALGKPGVLGGIAEMARLAAETEAQLRLLGGIAASGFERTKGMVSNAVLDGNLDAILEQIAFDLIASGGFVSAWAMSLKGDPPSPDTEISALFSSLRKPAPKLGGSEPGMTGATGALFAALGKLMSRMTEEPDILPAGSPEREAALQKALELVRTGALDDRLDKPLGGGNQNRIPLEFAIAEELDSLARALIERGAPVAGAPSGHPLILAAERGSLELVTLLLERGADPMERTRGEQTAMTAASGEEREEIIRVLRAAAKEARDRKRLNASRKPT